MKTKYLIGAAAISVALLSGGMAFAQTPAPAQGNENTNIPSAVDQPVPTLYDQGTASPTPTSGDTNEQHGLGGRGMMGNYGNNNFAGRGMMNYGAPNNERFSGRSSGINIISLCVRIFVMTVTMLLAWALMILGVLVLWLRLKEMRKK